MSRPTVVMEQIPAGAAEVAKNRTRGVMLRHVQLDDSLETIAAACYVQGMRDCVEVLERSGQLPSEPAPGQVLEGL